MQQVKIKKNLECVLTEPELKTASKALAEALHARSLVESKLDMFKAQVKSEVAAHDAVISRNAHLVNTEKEYRDVECEVLFDFVAGFKSYVRLDTGEVFGKDEITPAERQAEFDFQQAMAEKKVGDDLAAETEAVPA